LAKVSVPSPVGPAIDCIHFIEKEKMKFKQLMKVQRTLRWTILVARAGYWIDKLWQQLQRHQVFFVTG
jgi:hypothetical protein